jgi:undecaprenyl diphosphate synthase
VQHLAIIPDGNRRWAKRNKIESLFGHRKGLEVIRSAVSVCKRQNIKYLSIYTFSLENFLRSNGEKKYLFSLVENELVKQIPELLKDGVRVCFLGDRSLFPKRIHDVITAVEEKTKMMSKLILNLLFCYGARQEIVYAVKKLAQRVKSGNLDVSEIDSEMVSNYLWTSGIPDPDLIIRTGYRSRLSNFLLYQASYSEIKFLDCFWPEITDTILEDTINDFIGIQRNFGK